MERNTTSPGDICKIPFDFLAHAEWEGNDRANSFARSLSFTLGSFSAVAENPVKRKFHANEPKNQHKLIYINFIKNLHFLSLFLSTSRHPPFSLLIGDSNVQHSSPFYQTKPRKSGFPAHSSYIILFFTFCYKKMY
ncbi:hypothetical protein LC048_01470 [Mesobacillus subterraneus]|uniref:hypothetical protein n=1 Tax=Mesobacillus subterraneus TaxID=285983 RepID=UPI001CFDEF6A|nr:hypothetical protein [Mesobacillus subterraneus]WLR55712.1 hypothetical protein LC048_01470 [Mesobacillus subterraneus]